MYSSLLKVLGVASLTNHFLLAPAEESAEDNNEKTDVSGETEKVEEVSEAASEAPVEQPRGLGLLGNKRRPLLRRPGQLTRP